MEKLTGTGIELQDTRPADQIVAFREHHFGHADFSNMIEIGVIMSAFWLCGSSAPWWALMGWLFISCVRHCFRSIRALYRVRDEAMQSYAAQLTGRRQQATRREYL